MKKLFDALLYGCGFGFVAGFAKQCKHIFFICLYTRLVKRVDTEDNSAYSTTFFKEVDELANVIFVNFLDCNAYVGQSAVYVSQLGAKFGHFVYFVNALAGEEVKAVEVFFIVGEEK